MIKKIVFASNNKGKIRELKDILSPMGIEVVSQREAGFDIEADETGTTFAENSAIKAKAIYELAKIPVLADDSGLCVDALDGQPGVYSHRFAGENATDEEKCRYILEKLENVSDEKRTARFICDMCFIDENGREYHAEGRCEGKIGREEKGNNGFGYDPIFVVGNRTLAELEEAEKNKISHRAEALKKMKEILKQF
ncbi:MAG: RdgB/HAM1 family non-canonical purine NTP pyrophosphatase [Oscillospiraceae bacterium]|nr:RdgB/HAM1 family non-canonical purine NTP pyrophosphatase [Oscillospiraceae bacterium]MDD6085497.1 RdgB/HAM1 family non-canonical purine NTP pyrophosphatase [Oscillospiraceae bacterium]